MEVRYTLARAWKDNGPDAPCVCWMMFNPSSADDRKNDPTLRQCLKHSKRLGFGSLVVVNLWPFRTANPSTLRRFLAEPDDLYDELRENEVIADDEVRRADTVIVAWGNAWPTPPWLLEVPTWRETPLYCLETNANGSPRHPLARGHSRIADDRPLEIWRGA